MDTLNEVKALVESLGGNLSLLESMGFKVVRPRSSSCGRIFINHERGVVVKRSYLCDTSGTIPSYAIPTVILNLPLPPALHESEYGDAGVRYPEHYSHVLIQPLADVSCERQADAYAEFSNAGIYFSDMREVNLGYYNGKAVAIDW